MARRFASLIVTAAALVLLGAASLPKEASCQGPDSGPDVAAYHGEDPRVVQSRATMAKYIIMDENGTPTGAPHECTTAYLPLRNTYSDAWKSIGSFQAEDAGLCAAMCATSAISLLQGQINEPSVVGLDGPAPASNVEAGMAVVSDALGDKRACEAWVFCDDHVSYLVEDMAPLRRTDPSDIAFKPRATIVPPSPVLDPD